MKRLGKLVLGLIALAAVVWGIARMFVTDETRIKRQVSLMARAVEDNNLLRLEGAIAQDYSDDYGLDKSSLLAVTRSHRGQYRSLLIQITDLTVTVEPDRERAEAAFTANVLAQPASGGDSELHAEQMRLHFRKAERGWLLMRLESSEAKFD